MDKDDIPLTPEMLLAAYANGYFPMAESKDAKELHWFAPELRGVIPLEGFHIPKSLQKSLSKNPYSVTTDKAFEQVIRACGAREDTWINEEIIALYCSLHRMGFAHSVECWSSKELVGGLYGVALGGAFFGESMFSTQANASKIALVHLVELLSRAGYVLLDTQYINDHLKQFGVIEITKKEYLKRLQEALKRSPRPGF